MKKIFIHKQNNKAKRTVICTIAVTLFVWLIVTVVSCFAQSDSMQRFSANCVVAQAESGSIVLESRVKLASATSYEFTYSTYEIQQSDLASGYDISRVGKGDTIVFGSDGVINVVESFQRYTFRFFEGYRTDCVTATDYFYNTPGENNSYVVSLPELLESSVFSLNKEYSLCIMSVTNGYPWHLIYHFSFHYSLPLPEAPSIAGYTFAGWYYDEQFQQPYDGAPIYEDTKLYAKMDLINYTITYHPNEGTVSGKTSYNIENAAYKLPTPTRTGYDFMGWYTSADFSGNAVTEIPQGSMGDREFYAKWKIQTFKVSFYVNSELYTEMTVDYGTRLANLYIVEKATMKAVVLSLSSDMLTGYDMNYAITQDLSLFALEDFSICAGLTYNIDGVETMDLLEYGATLENLRTPEKEGHKFDGWFYDAEYTKAVNSTDKLATNTTVYAKFTKMSTAQTFWAEVGIFFRVWWWCFAVGGVVILAGVIASIVLEQKKKV